MMKYRLLLTLLVLNKPLFSQTSVNGFIKNRKDNTPVVFATVGIFHRATGCLADSMGKFSLLIPSAIANTDTVVITAIGYNALYIPIKELKNNTVIYIDEAFKELSPVIVRASKRSTTLGKLPKHGSSFSMGWGNDGQGGEAGNVFEIPFGSYQIAKVFAQISTTYDTCWFRLHIRKTENGFPGDEMLRENIIICTTVKEGAVEFDLSTLPYNFYEKDIFVGIELLKHSLLGSQSNTKKNYMVYMGNEPAKFRSFHKWYSNTDWEFGKGHSFSMKLVVKH